MPRRLARSPLVHFAVSVASVRHGELDSDYSGAVGSSNPNFSMLFDASCICGCGGSETDLFPGAYCVLVSGSVTDHAYRDSRVVYILVPFLWPLGMDGYAAEYLDKYIDSFIVPFTAVFGQIRASVLVSESTL